MIMPINHTLQICVGGWSICQKVTGFATICRLLKCEYGRGTKRLEMTSNQSQYFNHIIQGSFRCDVNVSVHKHGEEWGNRCELKNLNSVRFISAAIGT